MAYVLLFLLIGGFVFAGYMVRKTLKNLKDSDQGVEIDTSKITTSQDFLPFADIKNSVIDLGGFKYRAIIECTSTNYALKTTGEKEVIEKSFRQFLNALQFPITLYIQTKEINYGFILESLKKDIEKTTEEFPTLKEYARIYYNDVANLKSIVKNSKQKKKYIIVPYEDAIKMDQLNNDEKIEHSYEEISERCEILINNLSNMGLTGKRLKTPDLIELLYSIYHRDDNSIVDNIVSGDYLKTIVKGDKKPTKEDSLEKTISILQAADSQIKYRVINGHNPARANDIYQAISKNISDIRQGLIDIQNKGGLESLATDEEFFNMLEEKKQGVVKVETPGDELFKGSLDDVVKKTSDLNKEMK